MTMRRLKMKPVDMAEKLRVAYDRLAEQGLVERRDNLHPIEVHEQPDGSIEITGPPATIRVLHSLTQYMPSRTQVRRWDAHRDALHRWLPITCRQRQRNARRNLRNIMGIDI